MNVGAWDPQNSRATAARNASGGASGDLVREKERQGLRVILRILNHGNLGILLIMGNAEFTSSTVGYTVLGWGVIQASGLDFGLLGVCISGS